MVTMNKQSARSHLKNSDSASQQIVKRMSSTVYKRILFLLISLFPVDNAIAMECDAPILYSDSSITKSVSEASDTKMYRAHAIAMHGEPKYPSSFEHFDYVNPHAPTGGRISFAQRGTFNSFNPYSEKGNAVSTGSVETLTIQSDDEPFTQYGLIAEEMEWPLDRSSITFFINREAKWHDGRPITADDVIWSFNTLMDKGQPFYRYYYRGVSRVEAIDTLTVKFYFSDKTNRELPLIVGQLPVLPKHYWSTREFDRPTLEPPLGSGPYRINRFEAGRYVTLKRVDNYWGKDLPVRRGFNNFAEQHIKFYRDDTAIRLSLKAGETDIRIENQAKAWAQDYNVESVRRGWLHKRKFSTTKSQGMQAFIVNLRRPLFQDTLVRQALDYAFDFQWSNTNLFYSQYTRTRSFWSNSELAATGAPKDEEERIINHYRECLPDSVDATPYTPPQTNGRGWPRDNIEKAASLLKQAGYVLRDFQLVDQQTGEPFEFEILYSSPTFERIVLPYVHSLRRLGINASARIVDQSQYVTRLREFDFDMIWAGWNLSDSPGNELRDFFSSAAADNPASRNYSGIKNKIVDQLIELVIAAENREQLVHRTRALDRVLLAHHYVIPNWHLPAIRLLYWDKFGFPEIVPTGGPVINTWWIDQVAKDRLSQAIRGNYALISPNESDANMHSGINSDSIDQINTPTSNVSFKWPTLIFPILLLSGEVLLFKKIHRILIARKKPRQRNSLKIFGIWS